MKNRSSAVAVIIAVLLIGCLLGIAGYHFGGDRLQKHSASPDLQRSRGHAERLTSRLLRASSFDLSTTSSGPIRYRELADRHR